MSDYFALSAVSLVEVPNYAQYHLDDLVVLLFRRAMIRPTNILNMGDDPFINHESSSDQTLSDLLNSLERDL